MDGINRPEFSRRAPIAVLLALTCWLALGGMRGQSADSGGFRDRLADVVALPYQQLVDVGGAFYVWTRVTADGVRPTGRVQLLVDGDVVDDRPLNVGTSLLRTDLHTSGAFDVTVRYLGDDTLRPARSPEFEVAAR